MKKGLITITLLLTGTLLITPITNAVSQNDEQENTKTVNFDQAVNTKKAKVVKDNEEKINQVAKDNEEKINQNKENVNQNEEKTNKNNAVSKESEVTTVENKSTTVEKVKVDNEKEESTKPADKAVVEDDKYKQEVETGMTKSEAEAILNKYIKEVEQSDFTYTYKGDENNFKAMQDKGIRGYVFLPNAESDLAYLVDKDNGSIYFFHPSGYFELLQ